MELTQYSVSTAMGVPVAKLLKELQVWDAHAHLGQDKDGHVLSADALLWQMHENHVERAVVFPLNTPNDPDFTRSNDHIHRFWRSHERQVIPFFRLNPRRRWQQEFERRFSQGFRGIKLHPRSQQFSLTDRPFREICRRAEEANLVVLVHLGFGVRDIARQVYKIATDFPRLRLILGHAGFADIGEAIKLVGGFENVLFETSTTRVFDIFELLQHLDDRRIAFGSDVPYYTMDVALLSVLDTAIVSGRGKRSLRRIFRENLEKWLA